SGSDATRPEVRALELPQRTDPRRRAAGARRAPRSAARCGAIDRRSASRRPPEPRVLELYRSADAALFRESKDEGGRGGVFDRDADRFRSEEHTSELQSRFDLVCRLLLEKK